MLFIVDVGYQVDRYYQQAVTDSIQNKLRVAVQWPLTLTSMLLPMRINVFKCSRVVCLYICLVETRSR